MQTCAQQAASLRHRSASIKIKRITRVRMTPSPIPEKLPEAEKPVELVEFIHLTVKMRFQGVKLTSSYGKWELLRSVAGNVWLTIRRWVRRPVTHWYVPGR